jgi:hypothetical protein
MYNANDIDLDAVPNVLALTQKWMQELEAIYSGDDTADVKREKIAASMNGINI